jgi:hypothetical protein
VVSKISNHKVLQGKCARSARSEEDNYLIRLLSCAFKCDFKFQHDVPFANFVCISFASFVVSKKISNHKALKGKCARSARSEEDNYLIRLLSFARKSDVQFQCEHPLRTLCVFPSSPSWFQKFLTTKRSKENAHEAHEARKTII